LTAKDHRKRLDRLQWQGRYWPARRMLWKVKPDYRALGVARLFLRHRRGNVDRAIAKVPDGLRKDPGLLYERLRWRRRYGKYESAKEILDNPPGDLVDPGRWWIERSAITRLALIKGDVSAAYELAKNHGQDSGAAYAEAEWLAGWIALRFLDDPETAKGHFMSMHYAVKYPVSQARGAYWMARAMEATGDDTLAEDWHRLAADHPTTYYGQLSTARLHPGGSLALPAQPKPDDKDNKTFNAHELVKAARLLAAVGEQDRLKPFILRLDELAKTPGWRLLNAELAAATGRLDLSVSVSKRAARQGLKLTGTAYPVVTLPPLPAKSNLGVEAALVLAVVRQESAFYVKAKSHANAQGLMQLLPRTAFKVAKRLRVPFHRRRLISDGDYNLTLGQAYLRELVDEFKGSYVLALAAYNAGPGRARQWLRKNGDLRSQDVDSIDWVEKIPFRETRNYIQRVLENLQVYRRRLAKTEIALRLESDLHQ
jgi:soluble lytic murein transglycosylase